MALHAAMWERVVYPLITIAVTLVPPLLTALAYRGWVKRVREDLPPWRRVLGITSIVTTFLSWLALVISAFSVLMHFHSSFFSLSLDWVGGIYDGYRNISGFRVEAHFEDSSSCGRPSNGCTLGGKRRSLTNCIQLERSGHRQCVLR